MRYRLFVKISDHKQVPYFVDGLKVCTSEYHFSSKSCISSVIFIFFLNLYYASIYSQIFFYEPGSTVRTMLNDDVLKSFYWNSYKESNSFRRTERVINHLQKLLGIKISKTFFWIIDTLNKRNKPVPFAIFLLISPSKINYARN